MSDDQNQRGPSSSRPDRVKSGVAWEFAEPFTMVPSSNSLFTLIMGSEPEPWAASQSASCTTKDCLRTIVTRTNGGKIRHNNTRLKLQSEFREEMQGLGTDSDVTAVFRTLRLLEEIAQRLEDGTRSAESQARLMEAGLGPEPLESIVKTEIKRICLHSQGAETYSADERKQVETIIDLLVEDVATESTATKVSRMIRDWKHNSASALRALFHSKGSVAGFVASAGTSTVWGSTATLVTTHEQDDATGQVSSARANTFPTDQPEAPNGRANWREE